MNENELEPTAADLAECEVLAADPAEVDWESLLEPVITTAVVDEWDDDPTHDDRWDSGVPSWSAWA